MRWSFQVTSDAFDRHFSRTVGALILVACSVLVLKALAWLDPVRSIVLILALAAGWLVLGWQLLRRDR